MPCVLIFMEMVGAIYALFFSALWTIEKFSLIVIKNWGYNCKFFDMCYSKKEKVKDIILIGTWKNRKYCIEEKIKFTLHFLVTGIVAFYSKKTVNKKYYFPFQFPITSLPCGHNFIMNLEYPVLLGSVTAPFEVIIIILNNEFHSKTQIWRYPS